MENGKSSSLSIRTSQSGGYFSNFDFKTNRKGLMITIGDVVKHLDALAPPAFQEDYDNSGLITGDPSLAVTSVLVTLDCTEEVVHEAIALGANLIIAHHPIVFRGLKKITGKNYVERTVIKAIKHDVAIYAIHTNLDNVYTGVNRKIAEQIGLT